MDNTQGLSTAAPSQGQVAPQAQVPSNDAQGAVVGAPQDQSPAKGEAGTGEGLLLGKFKSPEDLAKAYQELESHNKKVEMDRAELEKLFVQSTEPSQEKPAPSQEQATEDPVDILAKEVSERVNRSFSPVVARLEVDSMVRKYGDKFIAIAAEVKAFKDANPNRTLESAYKEVAYDHLQKTQREQSANAQAQADASAQRAQVETSQPSGYRAPTIEDAIKDPNVSVTEISEALGPEYSKFAEISKKRANWHV